MTFVEDLFPNYGEFDATGTAVDDGILCPAGDVLDTAIKFGTPPQSWSPGLCRAPDEPGSCR
jgi:hypothetical protein